MYSRSSGYAIQALTYLAAQPSGKLIGAREMATRLEIPMPFLWKILRKLSEKKLVRSFKGVRGGYELARPARAISVAEILTAGREGDQAGRCVLGLGECDERDPCPLHPQWKSLRKQIEDRFEATTLADLVRNAKPAKRRRAQTRAISGRASS
jgi:Rrf2 family transcriptional regulator, iron-sulfur cluster assembly transcription factor